MQLVERHARSPNASQARITQQLVACRCLLVSYRPLAASAVKLVICWTRRGYILELEPLLAAFDVCEAMLLKGWLLLSSVLLPGCTCLLAPSRRRISTSLAAVNSDAVEMIYSLHQCVRARPQRETGRRRRGARGAARRAATTTDARVVRRYVGIGLE